MRLKREHKAYIRATTGPMIQWYYGDTSDLHNVGLYLNSLKIGIRKPLNGPDVLTNVQSLPPETTCHQHYQKLVSRAARLRRGFSASKWDKRSCAGMFQYINSPTRTGQPPETLCQWFYRFMTYWRKISKLDNARLGKKLGSQLSESSWIFHWSTILNLFN